MKSTKRTRTPPPTITPPPATSPPAEAIEIESLTETLLDLGIPAATIANLTRQVRTNAMQRAAIQRVIDRR